VVFGICSAMMMAGVRKFNDKRLDFCVHQICDHKLEKIRCYLLYKYKRIVMLT